MMKTTMRLVCTYLRLVPIVSVLAVMLLMPNGPAFGASLSVSSATVQEAGDTARVCVGLSAGSEDVAATQNELVWDANCASLVDKCEANSAHGKQLMSNQRSASELRAIIISLQDTNKIPDGELYCCTFRVSLANGGSCCAIGLQGMSASDPEGKALGLAGRGGQVCLARSAGSGGSALEGAAGQPPVVGADLGAGARQPAAQQPGQPAGQQPAAQGGTGNTVASGGTGGVQGGVGGVQGGIGGVPGGQPGAPVQPGQIAQPQQAAPGSAPAAGSDAGRVQAPVSGQRPVAGPEGTPTAGSVAAGAPPAAAPAAPRATAVPPKPAAPAAPAAPRATAKAAAPAAPAPAAEGGGCSCEITTSGVGFEASGALLAIGILLWARRKRI